MKRFFVIFMIVCAAAGCTNGVQKSSGTDKAEVTAVSEKSVECTTVVSSTEVDINKDGTEDTVSLTTSAEKAGDEIIWDDSNIWCVYADIGDKTYELLNKRISAGKVSYNIYENSSEKYVITVTEESTASYIVTEFTFDDDKLQKKTVIDENGINLVAASENE